MTRYVFIGAGAIGSAVGGLLAQAGTAVLLVARGDHAAAMIDTGLRVRCPDVTFTVDVPTVTGPQDVRLQVDDVLVLTTKTQQADAAINQWADVGVYDGDRLIGRAAETLPIMTALNGVASEDIALRYFDRVYAVCVWFPAVMIDPGEVLVRGAPLRGVFHVGRYPRPASPAGEDALLERLGADWGRAGCKISTPDAVMDWKYRKLISNLGNAVQALVGDGDTTALRAPIEAEARRVLAAAGVAVTSDATEAAARADGFRVQPVPGEPEHLGGSSWQSLVRGTGSIETDYLNGEIAVIARRHGLTAPLNTRLTALARQAAATGQRPGAISSEELRAALGI